MNKLLRYAFISALVALTLPLAPAHAAPAPQEVSLPLSEAIAALPVEDENRAGYQRSSFKHWTDADSDGCDTRIICTLRSR
ncbi:hypothetical protein ACFVUW_11860 [Streptomyces xiamenensis]|uniref:hypothetical protein n=1 Tax=Streptomyces xiamenensis TaxID=408015 RepID=UPI0036E2B0AF